MIKQTSNFFILLMTALFLLRPAQSAVIQMNIAFGSTDQGDIFVELFDGATPITASNFLNYIDDGNGNRRYDGIFFHRSISGFVIQGGGFKYDPAAGDFGTEASTPHILQDDVILNEFDLSRSNLRGTVAMAKLGGNPDSASSEWFFNLADNSANLDNQNGGFTVFGRVLGAGMTLVDSIAALATVDLSVPPNPPDPPAHSNVFASLPVVNSIQNNLVTDDDLVMISSMNVLNPVQPSVLDFGPTAIGGTATKVVTIQNLTGASQTNAQLSPNVVTAPFSLTDGCSGMVMNDQDSCALTITFQPTIAGQQSTSFTLDNDSNTISSLTIFATGTGALQAPTLSLNNTSQLDFGDAGPGANKQLDITLSNDGIDALTFTLIQAIGTGANAFSITNNCTSLQITESCTETITFNPATAGVIDAQLEIQSNDTGVASVTTIPILATASSDNDGIPDSIESGGHNNGDGNNDGIADSQQENVVSLPDVNGTYVALEVTPGITLTNVSAISSPSPATTPTAGSGSLTFPQGFYSFTLENVPVGGQATVTIHLAPGITANSYFKFGRLPNETPAFFFPEHWYQFLFDGTTGTGAEFNANQVILHLVDGGIGDNDQTANGIIVDPGGPALISAGNSSSGGGCVLNSTGMQPSRIMLDWWLIALVLFLLRQHSVYSKRIKYSDSISGQ